MLCENFFLHLHSHPIDLVVLAVDKDTIGMKSHHMARDPWNPSVSWSGRKP